MTSKISKVIIVYCSICIGKKSTRVSDNTIQKEALGCFLKSLGRVSAKGGKKNGN